MMANTLFDHGAKYHFHDVKITQSHATMKETGDKTNPSKLELLQEDYRSRLLHEREQKANALFEQKVRAELLPKKGSVREFFLNRRMLATSTTGASNGVNLPPIKRNTRYKGKQKEQTKRYERKEKAEASTVVEDMETQDDCNQSELEKLRKKYRKFKINQQVVSAMNMEKNSSSPPLTCDKMEANRDNRKAYLPKARGVKSREVYKRGRRPPSEESHVETNSKHVAYSSTENDLVSKSLVKIKELVHRRKTEELILRSKTTKLTAQDHTPSPRRNSQSFDEMCRVEIELRETISREQKKLLALQERRRQKVAERKNEPIETHNEIGGKEGQPMGRQQNTPSRGEKTTESVGKSKREKHQETYTDLTRLNSKETKQNCEYGMTDKDKNSKPMKKQQLKQKTSSSADASMDLVTCSNCGRGFMKERIAKHEKACKKASARIKKPFDAKRKRAEGTDVEKYIIMGKTNDDSQYKAKKSDWKRTHENFIQSIRSARVHDTQAATPLTNPDYIECSYCQRKFKPSVAETHIPRCKDIKARPRPPRR